MKRNIILALLLLISYLSFSQVIPTYEIRGNLRIVYGGDTNLITSSPAALSGWNLIGNAGINPLLNFLGTTDKNSFNIKAWSKTVMHIDTNGSVNIGVSTAII